MAGVGHPVQRSIDHSRRPKATVKRSHGETNRKSPGRLGRVKSKKTYYIPQRKEDMMIGRLWKELSIQEEAETRQRETPKRQNNKTREDSVKLLYDPEAIHSNGHKRNTNKLPEEREGEREKEGENKGRRERTQHLSNHRRHYHITYVTII